MNIEQRISDPLKVRSMLEQIMHHLTEFQENGAPSSLFLNQAGLTDQEQVDVLEYLGKGNIEVTMTSDEPVTWYETSVEGIWVGSFSDISGGVFVRTLEFASFPQLARVYEEDYERAKNRLREIIELAEQATVK